MKPAAPPTRRIPPEAVTVGMTVCGFGGSWFDHPFWLGRFTIRRERDCERIRQSGVPWVEVIGSDHALGDADAEWHDLGQALAPPAPVAGKPRGLTLTSSGNANPQTTSRALSRKAQAAIRDLHGQLRVGEGVDFEPVRGVVDDINAHLAHNAGAILDMVSTKDARAYTYCHSVAVAALLINFARHRGFHEAALFNLGIAGLMHDVGKLDVPNAVLEKADRLSDDEFALMRLHPARGLARLEPFRADLPQVVFDVCGQHHEKWDGTGYPLGLAGNAISEAAQMAAICDVYDALTSERVYKSAWPPAAALAAMWSAEGHFNRGLLFEFMKSIALYPEGMLVQLSNHHIARILTSRRGMTTVEAFYCTQAQSAIPPYKLVIRSSLALPGIVRHSAFDQRDVG